MEKPQTTISGIIVPAEWNEKGNILSIAIVTFDEDKFFIGNNDFARTLMTFLRKTVTLKGKVTTNGKLKIISVDQFHIHGE